MNLQDEITFGHITLRQLSELIESNMVEATTLQVQLTWGFQDKKMYGKILDGSQSHFEKYYHGKHVHQQIAQMHLDFHKQLAHLTAQRRRKLRPGRGGAAAGISQGRQVGSNIDDKL